MTIDISHTSEDIRVETGPTALSDRSSGYWVCAYMVNKRLEEQTADPERTPLSSTKALKLAYLSHGWHMGLRGSRLVAEPWEAWRCGPVVPRLAKELTAHPVHIAEPFARKEDLIPYFSDHDRVVMDSVYKVFSDYLINDLQAYTKKPNSPWQVTYKSGRGRWQEISDDLIRTYYAQDLARLLSNNRGGETRAGAA